VFLATGIRLSELAGICLSPDDPSRTDVDLAGRELRVRGKGGKGRIVKISHEAARALDRYLRARARHAQAGRPQLWLGVNNRGPLTPAGPHRQRPRLARHPWLAGRKSPQNPHKH
jgi:site-specific recombinase XerD